MIRIVLTGSGGCMRELLWQIEKCNQETPTYLVDGYVSDMEDLTMEDLCTCRYLGDQEYLLKRSAMTNVIICTTDLEERKDLVKKYSQNAFLHFPNLVLSSNVAQDVKLGQGVIISRECVVSSNVTMGDFCFLNLGAIVAHDGNLGSYTTLGIRVSLGGTVSIGTDCNLEMGALIQQGTSIREGVIIQAGSVIDSDV